MNLLPQNQRYPINSPKIKSTKFVFVVIQYKDTYLLKMLSLRNHGEIPIFDYAKVVVVAIQLLRKLVENYL